MKSENEIREEFIKETNSIESAWDFEGGNDAESCVDWFLTLRRKEHEEIKSIISSAKMEEAPPFSANDTFRKQAEMVNTHIMPAVREKLLSAIFPKHND